MRQFFYLLITLNLLLFLWIYHQTEQQLSQQQAVHPSIGNLRIVSEDAIQEISSDDVTGYEVERSQQGVDEPKSRRAAEQKSRSLKLCTTLGPVTTYVQAKIISAKLSRFNQTTAIRREVLTSNDAYEVLFPPFNSNDAATRTLRELQIAGVKDAVRITKGKQRKGISVGVYHYRDDAERRLLGIGKIAENPTIIERGDEATLYWIDMNATIEKRLTKAQIQNIRRQFSGIEIRKSTCSKQ